VRYSVSGDLRVAFVIHIDADSEAEAENKVAEMSYKDIEVDGNTYTKTAAIEIASVEKIT